MTNPTTAAVDRIPLTRSVHYVARGLPEVPNQYGPGVLAPSEVTLTYRAAPDSQLGRVHAYVAGRIWVDGKELPLMTGGLYGQHYDEGPEGWPAWLAEEARLHDPAALRDRIAKAARTVPLRLGPNAVAMAQRGEPIILNMNEADDFADAVLPLLPAPADRAAEEHRALKRAHVALAEQAGRDQAAVARVRRLHDALDAETSLTSPDQEITRGAAARKIAAALDGWTDPAELRRLAGGAAPNTSTEAPCSASHPHEPHDWLPFPGSGLVHKGVVHCRGREEAPAADTVHACPPAGSGVTPCCGRTPFELPRTDRMSTDPALVTCRADGPHGA